ncbi:MAG TPA: MopE-related protein, partial [Kofleriaceae bacterium]|nr:MopE-related protein [Kofleriaceae bacterium]
MVDTSGSMGLGSNTIYNSCGMPPSRINAAKCVLGDVFSSFGDADFGLGRFQMDCFSGPVYATATCNGDSPNMGEVVVPIASDNLAQLSSFVDFFPDYANPTGLSCPNEDPPELVVNDGNYGLTPLAGTLNAARRYYQGNDPNFGTSPIANDPFLGCRQYYVILLTDGDETCADLDDVEDAAAALRSTSVPGVGTVDIRTYVIGFGVPDGDNDVEAIAAAGGTTALFAQDEASLSLAFAQVIQDSLVNEVCNNVDDDCDGNIDEGFQKYCDLDGAIGTPTGELEYCAPVPDDCDDVDDNCFLGTNDEPKNACGFCGPVPTETCNQLDDDCDDSIDEGDVCAGCTPTGAEVCNNLDEDCDGNIDEGLTRSCGTDVGECVAGEEQCVAGQWEGCDAVGPEAEECDGLDNDCDGNIDGFAEQCVEDPNNGPPFDGVCQPGIRVCPSDGSGQFGPCLGEVGPTDEACDLEDDDCDGDVDEDTGGADCSSDCGVGVTECVGGVLECNSDQTPVPEMCNNFDDDCDGTVDEEIPSGGPCDEDGTLCVPGELQCIAGEMQCVGGEEPLPEICDCEDNDCDGEIDEPGVCPPGSACVNCQCATACGDGEFPCPVGLVCEEGYCVTDLCFGVTCPPTEDGLQACQDGTCVPICDTVTCPQGLACHPSDGSCRTDDCIGFPERCAEDELCVGGTCEPDPCVGVDCPGASEYCLEGECVTSCGGVTCPEGERCELGACTPDRCIGVQCLSNQFCDPETGTCVEDQCRNVSCRQGETCDPHTGDCVKEPCLGVECPGDEVCSQGTCFDPSSVGPDGGLVDHEYVSAGGGGGCSAGGGGTGPAALLLSLLALAPLLRRRSRANLAAAALFAAAGVAGTGCQSDGYCITCVNPAAAGDGGPGGDAGPLADAGMPGDGGPGGDACPMSGVEQCDGLDNDCDGAIDEGNLEGEGLDCGTDVGECSPGTTECVGGRIVCGGGAVLPVQESCDTLDNDCDG